MSSTAKHKIVLNEGGGDYGGPFPAVELSKELQKLMLKIKGSFISEDGHTVDYGSLRESSLFREYIARTKALKDVKLNNLDHAEKVAFFLNIYNSLTIHGLAVCDDIPNSVLEMSDFWRKTAYNIGGFTFSLDDIEHGILRGNRVHPSDGKTLFCDSDPRLEFTVSEIDPRIHFALVCGAKSCPAINVFTAKNLDRALEAAARSFCSQEVVINDKQVILSRIFLWYRTDFGSSDSECLRWISHHLTKEEQGKLNSLLEQPNLGDSFKICYNEYNWNLNGSKL